MVISLCAKGLTTDRISAHSYSPPTPAEIPTRVGCERRISLERLTNLPEGVIGFEAVGEVDASDYERTLRPAVDEAARSAGVGVVYVLGDRFDGYSGGASWEDTKLGLAHLRSWKRTAPVSDVEWVEHLAMAFGWMMPGKFRRLPLAQMSDAIAWVAAVDDDGERSS